MTLIPGDVIGGYRIKRRIAGGGFGEVYLASHPRLPVDLVIKVPWPHMADDPGYRKRFLKEAELAIRVRHPNIVEVHDRGSDDEVLWIAMSYVEGRNLAEAIKADGPFPYARALHIVDGVAGALDEVHRQGLLHRDVKPDNILLGRFGDREHPYLTDFGVAKDLHSQTVAGSIAGTAPYMPPEAFGSEPLDGRVDVYALGAVFYEMLTGRQAFDGRTPHEIIGNVFNTWPPLPSALSRYPLSPEVDSVVLRALAKDRTERYPTCRDFVAAARSALVVERPRLAPVPPVTVLRTGGTESSPTLVRSDELSRSELGELLRELEVSDFLSVVQPPEWLSVPGQKTELLVSASNAANTLAWRGDAPASLATLSAVVSRLGSVGSTPGKPDRGQAKTHKQEDWADARRKRPRRRWPIVVAGVGLAAAIAVPVLLLTLPKDGSAPAAPTAVSATAEPGAILLSWSPSTNATQYDIYRDHQLIDTEAGTKYTDNRNNDTARHSYYVIARNRDNQHSQPSEVVAGAADPRPLNSAEQALVAELPNGLAAASTCAPQVDWETSGVKAAVTCDLEPGASTSQYVPPTFIAYVSDDQSSYDSDVRNGLRNLTESSTACNVGVSGYNSWIFRSDTPSQKQGTYYCGVFGGYPEFLWTYDDALTTLVLSERKNAAEASLSQLYSYWHGLSDIRLSR